MNTIAATPFLIALAVVAPLSLQAGLASLLLEYKFNETGTDAASTGPLSTPVTMRENFGTEQDLHGEPGSGVSGHADDLAFHNVFTVPVAGYADQADLQALDGLRSFTLQGWFKTEDATPIQRAALIDKAVPGTGFIVYSLAPGSLILGVIGAGVVSPPVYTETQEWVFFAVTCSISGQPRAVGWYSVNFYKGTASLPVTIVGSANGQGLRFFPDNNVGLRIGSSQERDKPFVGYLDNFRIFGSQTDGSAFLNPGLLEELRQSDVQNDSRANVLDLSATRAGGQVVIAWRKTSFPFALQTKSRVTPDVAWEDVSSAPEPSGENLTVTLPAASGLHVFRLVRP